jgi:hypothetical protein
LQEVCNIRAPFTRSTAKFQAASQLSTTKKQSFLEFLKFSLRGLKFVARGPQVFLKP